MKKIILFSGFLLALLNWSSAQDAKEIVRKAYEQMRGKSNQAEMTMTIIRPAWTRSVSFKSWSEGRDFSLTLITAPAKEKGQTFLKLKNKMWTWNPSISRMIKLPSSLMSDGWMGSDYSNDDILKESSIVVDYNHKLIGNETIEGRDCYKIEMIPKEESGLIWGKVLKWISKKNYLQLKTEYYDEDNFLIKSELASVIKVMDGREIPTKIEIIPEEDAGNKTIVLIKNVKFNVRFKRNFFSQQNMKRIR